MWRRRSFILAPTAAWCRAAAKPGTVNAARRWPGHGSSVRNHRTQSTGYDHVPTEGEPMKVTAVAVDALQTPVEHPYIAAGRRVDANWHILARITTDDGSQGF